jgi:hypothetical protein
MRVCISEAVILVIFVIWSPSVQYHYGIPVTFFITKLAELQKIQRERSGYCLAGITGCCSRIADFGDLGRL